MFLTDTDIIERIRTGDIRLLDPDGKSVIDPETGRERERGQFEAHGYDLRARRVYSWHRRRWIDLAHEEKYTLRPGEMVAVETYEGISLSRKIAATVHSRARMTLQGFSHISTTVHPGWPQDSDKPAPLVVALSNVGRSRLDLTYKQPFCRLIFHEAGENAFRAAPTLDQVTEMFEFARKKAEQGYSRRIKLTGWGLGLATTALCIALLWIVNERAPSFAPGAIALVAALLPLVFTFLRHRFNLLDP